MGRAMSSQPDASLSSPSASRIEELAQEVERLQRELVAAWCHVQNCYAVFLIEQQENNASAIIDACTYDCS